MKIYIKIAETFLPILIDIRASIYVISKDLIKKLKLKIKPNDETKVVLLGGENKVKVIRLIPNIPIAIQNLHIS